MIDKCLEKDKERRYQSVNEIILDLETGTPLKSSGKSRINAFGRWSLVFFSVFLASFVLYNYLSAAPVPSLAVLPFANESNAPELDYLSQGMTEGITQKIAAFSKLSVKPFKSFSGYKDSDLAHLARGNEIAVDYLVTGRLIKRGDQVFLQYSLIKTSDNSNLGGDTKLLDNSTALSVEEQISQTIVSKLAAEGRVGATNIADKRGTNDSTAFDEYMRGRHYWGIRNKDNITRAISAFTHAVEIDPSYAEAYAGLADAYVVQSGVAYGSFSPDEIMPKAEWAAKKAIKIDDSLADLHAALAVVYSKYEYRWQEAENEFKLALACDPEYAQAHYWYSELLATLGKTEEAIAEAYKAQRLEPFSPLTEMNVGRVQYLARQYDEAETYLNRALTKHPDNVKAKYILSLIYLQKKMYPESLKLLEDLYASDDNRPLSAAALGFA